MRLTTVIAAALIAAAASTGRATDPPSAAKAVHEWGTFTSIAGPDGRPVEWTPQAGTSDLPCFVARNRFVLKGSLRGTVRMETPVLYFYAPAETHASVRVRFNGGAFTEWFPHAAVSANPSYGAPTKSAIAWPDVNVRPELAPDFPTEPGTSHYELLRAFADDATLRSATEELEANRYRTHEFGDSVLIEKAA